MGLTSPGKCMKDCHQIQDEKKTKMIIHGILALNLSRHFYRKANLKISISHPLERKFRLQHSI